ncbi:DUF5105 domain-containing protein [uncultured Clostridium sp.]|uniref:DUF5105 domain-containing protein n=1 Tax=uncultured Clostridium sp. TaxID=59620 RepID=UPI0028EFAB86|nr:DUF5105 domain-containing protein [uncultured Clostridium sp.]
MLATMITGCSKKVAPPEDFAKAFYESSMYLNTDTLVSLGMSDDEANTLKAECEEALKDEIKNNLKSNGLQCTDEQVNLLYDAQLTTQKKATCTIETITSDEKTAVVKIKTTHINIQGIGESSANDAIKEIQNMNITDTNVALAKALELYIAKFTEGCNNTEASSDTLENTFTFKKMKDDKNIEAWVPDNPVTFGNQLATMICQ